MLAEMKIGTRVLAGMMAVAAVTLGLGLYSANRLSIAEESDRTLYEQNTVPLGDFGDFRAAVARARRHFAVLMTVTDAELRREPRETMEKDLDIAAKALAAVDERVKFPEVRKVLAQVQADYGVAGRHGAGDAQAGQAGVRGSGEE